jgi:hypothetical protein
VLLLEDTYLDSPGSLRHPDTFTGGSVCATVTGASAAAVLGDSRGRLAPSYLASARELRGRGAQVLTANCGYAISYQEAVARELDIPVALSSLVLVAPLARLFGGRLGVLTFDRECLDEARRADAGWPAGVRIAIGDVQSSAEWRKLASANPPELDLELLRRDLLDIALPFAAGEELAALLLECTGMVPFRREVARACGLAVFDVLSAVELVAAGELV